MKKLTLLLILNLAIGLQAMDTRTVDPRALSMWTSTTGAPVLPVNMPWPYLRLPMALQAMDTGTVDPRLFSMRPPLTSQSQGLPVSMPLPLPSEQGIPAAVSRKDDSIIGLPLPIALQNKQGRKRGLESKTELRTKRRKSSIILTETVDDVVVYICPFCRERCSAEEAMTKHTRSCDPDAIRQHSYTRNSRFCTMKFSTPSKLDDHYVSHGETRLCQYCNVEFATAKEWASHKKRECQKRMMMMRALHAEIAEQSIKEKPTFKCSGGSCHGTFETNDETVYRLHLTVENNGLYQEIPCPSPGCRAKKDSRVKIFKHIMTHANNQNMYKLVHPEPAVIVAATTPLATAQAVDQTPIVPAATTTVTTRSSPCY